MLFTKPKKIINCVSLPDATISSMPKANVELAKKEMAHYYSCWGKRICKGCVYSFTQSGNIGKCHFCNADRASKTNEEVVEDVMKRVEANDVASINLLADTYYKGLNGVQQDRTSAMELYVRAADLGNTKAHGSLSDIYHEGGGLKKAKFHCEAAAMAGHEGARCNLGTMEAQSGNIGPAVKHWMIAASCGNYKAMQNLLIAFNQGSTSRATIDSTLTAYNTSCVEMRSEARDAYINTIIHHNM